MDNPHIVSVDTQPAGPTWDQNRLDAWLGRMISLAAYAGDKVKANELAAEVRRVMATPEHIAHRCMLLPDFQRDDPADLTFYNFYDNPHGANWRQRSEKYAEAATGAMRAFYPDRDRLPDELVHVTCTGYISPSPAQVMLSERGWCDTTRVMHCYHMGCYAAMPALRLATSQWSDAWRRRDSHRVIDVVHTEFCSLHFDPQAHTPDQLVVLSLFGDGIARVRVADAPAAGRSLSIEAFSESLIADSLGAMTWIIDDHHLRMTLSRDVPGMIAVRTAAWVEDLCRKAGCELADIHERLVLALHPGGPRIIDQVQEVLGLRPSQLVHVRGVLHDHGNMSSATVPHIWQRILADPGLSDGTPVISIAFGPGLTISGCFLRLCQA